MSTTLQVVADVRHLRHLGGRPLLPLLAATLLCAAALSNLIQAVELASKVVAWSMFRALPSFDAQHLSHPRPPSAQVG